MNNQGKERKKVRTLLRVSTRQQLHEDDIPVQRAEVMAYIAGRPDWIYDGEYVEKAVSAYKNGVAEREILQLILEDAGKQKFDVLLAYMSDRIGRQEEYSTYVATLNRLGIQVWTIKDGQLKTEEHVDKLLNYIRFWQNAGESEKTSKRVRDTQRELIKSGKFLGGKAPYGYELLPSGEISNHGRVLKKLSVVGEKADIVRKIYELAVYQGMGYEKIAKTLNEKKIQAPETDRWKPSTIAGILKNPIYMGYPCINRRKSNGSYMRTDRREWVYSEKQIQELVIVPQDVWERYQEIREARRAQLETAGTKLSCSGEEMHTYPINAGSELLLLGLAYCGYCGKKLKSGSYHNTWITKAGERKKSFVGRYVCPQKCEQRQCYAKGYLEGPVMEVVDRYLRNITQTDILEEVKYSWDNKFQNVEKEIQRRQKESEKCVREKAVLEAKIPEAILGEYCFSAEKLSDVLAEKEHRMELLEQEICDLQRKKHAMEKQVEIQKTGLAGIPDWREVFKAADIRSRKMVLFSLFEKIVVKDREITIYFNIQTNDLL